MNYRDLLDIMIKIGAEPAPTTSVTFRGAGPGGKDAYVVLATPGLLDNTILTSAPGSFEYDLVDVLTCPLEDIPLKMVALPQGDDNKAMVCSKIGAARMEGLL